MATLTKAESIVVFCKKYKITQIHMENYDENTASQIRKEGIDVEETEV